MKKCNNNNNKTDNNNNNNNNVINRASIILLFVRNLKKQKQKQKHFFDVTSNLFGLILYYIILYCISDYITKYTYIVIPLIWNNCQTFSLTANE